MKHRNVVIPVSNYATNTLQETLTRWGKKDISLLIRLWLKINIIVR